MNVGKRFHQFIQKFVAGLVVLCMLIAILPTINAQATTPIPVWDWSPGIHQIATSGDHTMVIKADGSLWGFGANNNGQLGDGTRTDRLSPVRIGSDYDWVYVATSSDSIVNSAGNQLAITAAIRSDGNLWAWGNLLTYLAQAMTVPARVGTSYNWASVVVGTQSIAAIDSYGGLWQWGIILDRFFSDVYGMPILERVNTTNDWVSLSGAGSNWLRPGQRPLNEPLKAIGVDGSLWSFWAEMGQIGVGTTWVEAHGLYIPQPHVPFGHADIRAYMYIIAVAVDGSVWTWRYFVWTGHAMWHSGEATLVGQPCTNTASIATRTNGRVQIMNDGSFWVQHYGGASENFASSRDQVGTDYNWTSIVSAGGGLVFAMRDDGSIWAEGYGLVGDGTDNRNHRLEPVMIWCGTTAPILSAGSASAMPSETVRIPISLHNNPGIAGFNITINYDNNILTPAPLNDGDIRRDIGGSVFVSNTNHNDGEITAVWASPYEVEDEHLFYIYFTVDQYASTSTRTTVSITIEELKHLNHDNVTAIPRSGTIRIVDQHAPPPPPPPPPLLWGDVNQDGYVDIFDLIRLAQHISGTPGMALTGIGLQVADVFYDSEVNLSDLIHLAQFLASENMSNPDVVLGPGSR